MSNHIDTTVNLQTYVDPYPGKDAAEVVLWPCTRCGGTGHVYSMIDGGICYLCDGRKGDRITVETARKRTKAAVQRRNRKERELVKEQEFHNEQMEKAEAAFPILAGWFESISTNNFMSDLWVKAFKYELSDKQIAAAAAVLQREADYKAQREQEAADAAPAPTGKIEVEGEIVSVKYKESQYGGAWKMVVKHESGWKAWGTIPTAIFDQQRAEAAEGENPFADALKGRRVAFTATLEASADDNTFAFFKRPTKARLLPQD